MSREAQRPPDRTATFQQIHRKNAKGAYRSRGHLVRERGRRRSARTMSSAHVTHGVRGDRTRAKYSPNTKIIDLSPLAHTQPGMYKLIRASEHLEQTAQSVPPAIAAAICLHSTTVTLTLVQLPTRDRSPTITAHRSTSAVLYCTDISGVTEGF